MLGHPDVGQGVGMTTSRLVLMVILTLALLAATLAVEAQPPGAKAARIGYLSSYSVSTGRAHEAFRQGLRDLGYVEGRNLTVEYRWADGNYERLPGLAKELVALDVDLIVSVGGPSAARAAKAATTSIPIVFVSGAAVEAGIVSSLARPGGNLTGFDVLAEELDGKRLELLKEMLPKVTQVAVLWNPGTPEGEAQHHRLAGAAPAMGVKLRFLAARNPRELDGALAALGRERAEALLVSADAMIGDAEAGRIIKWTTGARLPTIAFDRRFPRGGALASYGTDTAAIYRRAAGYVDRILKGARPGDLPVEQPTKFELVINLKTAKALGLTIPPSVLVRVDQVIE
jgi:putative ABC transport system substrate-binding protein